MKLITAIIREEKLDEVRQALIDAEIERITVSRVAGHGQQTEVEFQRGQKVIPNLIPRVQIVIACNDAFEDITVNAILKAAKTGKDGEVGDGKIFVQDLPKCIRIRTGESGGQAI